MGRGEKGPRKRKGPHLHLFIPLGKAEEVVRGAVDKVFCSLKRNERPLDSTAKKGQQEVRWQRPSPYLVTKGTDSMFSL